MKSNISKKKVYSVATGAFLIPFDKKSDKIITFIKKLDGFFGVHPLDMGILWFFDSLEHAQSAKEKMTDKGIKCGNNICPCVYDPKGHHVTVYSSEDEAFPMEQGAK